MAYYYSNLSDKNKKLYDIMFDGINKLERKIALPHASGDDLFSAFNSVIYDNPLLFYTRSFRSAAVNLGWPSSIIPVYKYDADFINSSAHVISEYLETFEAVRSDSDLEKELFVHDHCLDNFTYDMQMNEHAFSALGPVVFNTGVCEGISKFVKLALNYLGVDCIVVTGRGYSPVNPEKAEPHMWNMVYVNGVTYHLDVTFDLTQKGSVNRYDYFNLPDNEILKDHSISRTVPACETAGDDYYSLSEQVFGSLTEAEKYIEAQLREGNTSIVFKLINTEFDSRIVNDITQVATLQFQKLRNTAGFLEVRPNLKQGVFELGFKT